MNETDSDRLLDRALQAVRDDAPDADCGNRGLGSGGQQS